MIVSKHNGLVLVSVLIVVVICGMKMGVYPAIPVGILNVRGMK